MHQSSKILRDRSGVAAIEYAIIASLIAVASVAGMTALGDRQDQQFSNIDNKL